MAERTPAFTHSAIKPGTVGAGVMITARSTFAGMSPIFGQHRNPIISARAGLIGYTFPLNVPEVRFARTVRPTLPSRSVAPMTATDSGINNPSNVDRLLILFGENQTELLTSLQQSRAMAQSSCA